MGIKDACEKIYKLVKQIPEGKVTTYGTIAKRLDMSPRFIGYALHLNPYEGAVPCHRVVNFKGQIAPSFAFGGSEIQRELLLKEGVKFKNELHVDLKDFLVTF